jgi:hypothetical protein
MSFDDMTSHLAICCEEGGYGGDSSHRAVGDIYTSMRAEWRLLVEEMMDGA